MNQSHGTQYRTRKPSRRIILLGASNLTRGISTAVETARQVWGHPLEILLAYGHGRSYGMRSAVLVRELPGINTCGLWRVLKNCRAMPTAALITDIGNDLLYGASVQEIAEWIDWTVKQLQAASANVVVTRLPITSISTLSPFRYRLLRSILFPQCDLELDTVRERARELDEKLERLCRNRKVHLAEHRANWYGYDPIHIKMRHWVRAWEEFMAPWGKLGHGTSVASASLRRWAYLRCLPPERRWLLGIEQRRRQPAGRLPDGSIVWIF